MGYIGSGSCHISYVAVLGTCLGIGSSSPPNAFPCSLTPSFCTCTRPMVCLFGTNNCEHVHGTSWNPRKTNGALTFMTERPATGDLLRICWSTCWTRIDQISERLATQRFEVMPLRVLSRRRTYPIRIQQFARTWQWTDRLLANSCPDFSIPSFRHPFIHMFFSIFPSLSPDSFPCFVIHSCIHLFVILKGPLCYYAMFVAVQC
jgi:hypothetical protein